MKTNELTGAALDWAVAKCEVGDAAEQAGDWWKPSTKWAIGGPIIEREKISTTYDDVWTAEDVYGETQWGDTALQAAMRCYVASKLGEEVDVPKELQP